MAGRAGWGPPYRAPPQVRRTAALAPGSTAAYGGPAAILANHYSPRMPFFDDYNRTIIGYHGTRRDVAMEIIQGLREFKPSENIDDWLGHGVYFWEHAPRQALRWAQGRYRRHDVAVVASMIRLGNCFDLLDPQNADELRALYKAMVSFYRTAGKKIPQNYRARKHLDCAVFQFAYAEYADRGAGPIDTCRAVYVPTGAKARLWRASWLYEQTHIQLCVRNPRCILGTWLVKLPEENADAESHVPSAPQQHGAPDA